MFVAERNTGLEASRMWDVVKQFSNTHVLYQTHAPSSKRRDTPQERPGIFLDFQLKNRYAVLGANYLEEKRVMFLHDGVAGNPYQECASAEFRKLQTELLAQLKRCRRVVPRASIDNQIVRVTWSGKVNENGQIQAGLNDDLAVTFCTATYWADRIMQLDYPGVNYAALGLK